MWKLTFCVLLCIVYNSSTPLDRDQTDFNISHTKRLPRRSNKLVSRRQVSAADSCTFGRGGDLTMCGWKHLYNDTTQKWKEGNGGTCNWIGGPCVDATDNDDKGGYIVFDSSQIPSSSRGPATQSGLLVSQIMEPTGPKGACLVYDYASEGLSVYKLRVVIHPIAEGEDDQQQEQLFLRRQEAPQDFTLFETREDTNGLWRTAEVVYASNTAHQVVVEAVPKDVSDPLRRYRGYWAVDNLDLRNLEGCPGHCTFDGGLCGWTNEESDDFDWKLGRGSLNPLTGPVQDRGSVISNSVTGGYAYIDTSYPRRPGDKARLASIEFSPNGADNPLCMVFSTHMYGNGIGRLRVLLHDIGNNKDREVWSLSGEAGNNWYQAQVPISSSEPFTIVFEGEVGKNNLGDIAIDDIAFSPGACPSAPQTASPSSGDCTFEVDECSWINVGSSLRLDDIDWERRLGQAGRAPPADHTLGTPSGYFMMVATSNNVQRSGDSAWLMSKEFEPNPNGRCLSFYYYMHEPFIDSPGPNLGSLKVYTRSVDENGAPKMKAIWRLYNQQGPKWKYAQAAITETEKYFVVFEGLLGASRTSGHIAIDDITFFEGACTTMPESGFITEGECSFEKDSCMWRNSSKDPLFQWQLASISRRPANLPDATFNAPVGYVYFDIFNQNSEITPVRLISPVLKQLPGQSQTCVTFKYAGFGAGEATQLKLLKQLVENSNNGNANKEPAKTEAPEVNNKDASDQEGELLWHLDSVDMDTVRPEWKQGQVTIDAKSPYRIILEGQATNGGFAVDDLTFYPGKCPTRPASAVSKSK